MKIGEILVSKGYITHDNLDEVLKIQQEQLPYNVRFGEICISHGFCSEAEIINALSEQLDLYTLDLFVDEKLGEVDNIQHDLVESFFNPEWWRQRQAYPLLVENSIIYVALLDVWDAFVASSLKKIYDIQTIPILVSHYELRKLHSGMQESTSTNPKGELEKHDVSSAPVVRFVNECIQSAIKSKASDIHFEINKDTFIVRFRIDGVLKITDRPGISQHAAIISRIKLMSGLDISERRLPQDGRMRVRLSGVYIDIRVATTPTVHGENAVLRLLSGNNSSEKRELNMFPDQLSIISEIINQRNGIFLITGPTGSGKTTSLYTLLAQINDDDKKIITVEDPVEYQMAGLTQIQVNSDIGLDFSTVLRSALRQDPDVMLIGEMRDKETAQIAIQSALTGHFVYSTLHTNDAPSSFIRLKDIGVPDYLIKSTIVGVMAQRLLRKLCPECSVSDSLSAQKIGIDWSAFSAKWAHLLPKHVEFKSATGCEKCNHTGYKGRVAIFELMRWNSSYDCEINSSSLNMVANTQGMRTLKEDAILRAAYGETSLEEVMRVVG
ncbi:TPA: Flp pilus assembly complex ATPase component TadA [Aeromonas veronii]|uniref:ATPase, T2SS/T4P/T4SS family n=1 Tax=Aeromonas caviae TaxID=648 RepID=A0ABU5W5L0_AERCA|nr:MULTISPECIES: GspE/PulE family protein [Aeromonas]MBO0505580.1 Flp pilus assembly complex ATPase component TadA [Aeromonas veronii]MEA9436202.1 ATPase, T2SS/T4P/T4SS family [Aeromonas caviae]OEC54986.1 S-protein secretion protein E [Aeromonas sp. ANNP30]OEC65344.1 S-protein secretion protein E [Aeromonas sp. ANP5]SIQ21455.1 general secretion pathway protein E [Aeromonas veronii]